MKEGLYEERTIRRKEGKKERLYGGRKEDKKEGMTI